MPWYNPLSWFDGGSRPAAELEVTEENLSALMGEQGLRDSGEELDVLFDLRHQYVVSSNPAGHYEQPGEDHRRGEGSWPYVILRMNAGAMPDQYEHVSVEEDDPGCTPEGYLPGALMRALKNDMHIRRYKPLWGWQRELGEGEEHPEKQVPECAVGEIGTPVREGSNIRIPITFALPKGETRDGYFAQNVTNALTNDPYLGAQELVSALRAENLEEISEYDRDALRLTLTCDLKADTKGELHEAWRGKKSVIEKRRCRRITRSFLEGLSEDCRVKDSNLPNIYCVTAAMLATAFEPGSDEHFRAEIKLRDTRQNTIRQVGSLYAFAVIQNAINASASGDGVEVYGNGGTPLVSGDYNENLTDNALNGVQLIGMLESADGIMPAIRIHSNAGQVFTVAGNDGWHLENFEVDGESGATYGIQMASFIGSVSRCVVHDCVTVGIDTGNDSVAVSNCVVYDCGIGFDDGTTQYARFVHCTAVDNTVGFNGPFVNDLSCRACLASDNGTDYVNAVAQVCAWNVSSDLTAPGAGSRTGFTNNNFVNYAGDDFRLIKPQNATGADIDGRPLVSGDYLAARRSRSDAGASVFFAGAHHPITVPTGLAATDPGTDGDLDVTWTNAASYTDSELLKIYDNTAGTLLGVFLASAGTGRITGLTNGTAYTLVARATAENLVESGDSNTVTETPTGGGGGGGGGIRHVRVLDRLMLDVR